MANCFVTSLCLLGLVGAITGARIVNVDQLLAVPSESQGIPATDSGLELDTSPYQPDLDDIDLDISDLLQGCSKGKCELCRTDVVKVCIVATVLSRGLGIDIILTIDGVKVFNKVINVSNPPPFCVKKVGNHITNLCLTVYNITLKEISACTKLSLTIKISHLHKKVSFKIGCFKLIPTVDGVWNGDGDLLVEDMSQVEGGEDNESTVLVYKPDLWS